MPRLLPEKQPEHAPPSAAMKPMVIGRVTGKLRYQRGSSNEPSPIAVATANRFGEPLAEALAFERGPAGAEVAGPASAED